MSLDTQASLTIDPYRSRKERYRKGQFSFPLGVRLANKLLSSYKTKALDVDEIMAKAIKKAGRDDFGDLFWLEPMREVFKDLNKSTNFHPLGAYLFEQKAVLTLVNRLWSQYWLSTDSSIDRPLPPTVLISGLQRTGTTFLQRLLGALPEFRGIVSWELINPVPISKRKTYYGKYQAMAGHSALNYINPELKPIHAFDHNSLDEEVVLLEHCYMSSIFEAALTTPIYGRWLESQDQKPAYRDLKMWLKFLLWRQPTSNFLLLKSSHHMEYLDDFFHVFPNTKVIRTHRKPEESMASYCSMIQTTKKLFQPSSDPLRVGKHWSRKNKRLVDHCHNYQKDHQDQFIDISYKELVKDPISMVQEIYKQLGIQWSAKHTDLARDYCEVHKKNKFGKHVYDLKDYGLTKQGINNQFSDYMDAYREYL